MNIEDRIKELESEIEKLKDSITAKGPIEENPISTKELCEKRNIKVQLLSYYKTLGLECEGFNQWYLSKFDNWMRNIYPKLPRGKRGPKPKDLAI